MRPGEEIGFRLGVSKDTVASETRNGDAPLDAVFPTLAVATARALSRPTPPARHHEASG
jgi:hypothetical protein